MHILNNKQIIGMQQFVIRAVPNIRFIFASVLNSGVANSLFIFSRKVMLNRIQIVQSYASHRVHARKGWKCFMYNTWSCKLQCCFLLELSEQPIINDMHKRNSQFQDNDKYDIKSFEHTTVLTPAVHNVYQSKKNLVLVYSWKYSYSYLAWWLVQLFIFGRILSIPIWYSPSCYTPTATLPGANYLVCIVNLSAISVVD